MSIGFERTFGFTACGIQLLLVAWKSKASCRGLRMSAVFPPRPIGRRSPPCCSSMGRCCAWIPWMNEIGRPHPTRRLPVVLTPEEVARVLGFLDGEHRLFAQLLYGTGMRISDGAAAFASRTWTSTTPRSLCAKERAQKIVPCMLPQCLAAPMGEQLVRARSLWAADQAAGCGGVAMPSALERKYPRAGHSWPWFWVFPQHKHSVDPRSGVVCRHHLYDQTFQRAFKKAVEIQASPSRRPCCAAVTTSAPCKDFSGIQTLPPTRFYTHVLKVGGAGVRSPWMRYRMRGCVCWRLPAIDGNWSIET